jgi:hypothetical protein
MVSWSNSPKTCNFEDCSKLKRLNCQWWQFSIFKIKSHFIFSKQKIQLERNLLQLYQVGIFKIFNVIHDDFLGAYVRESWFNFWIGTDLINCELRVTTLGTFWRSAHNTIWLDGENLLKVLTYLTKKINQLQLDVPIISSAPPAPPQYTSKPLA